MEKLQSALFFDTVPDTWTKLAYPSSYSLSTWCVLACLLQLVEVEVVVGRSLFNLLLHITHR